MRPRSKGSGRNLGILAEGRAFVGGIWGISKTTLTQHQDVGFNSLARTPENRANLLLGDMEFPSVGLGWTC